MLFLRVEDGMFDQMGVDYSGILHCVSSRFDEVRLSYQTSQAKGIEDVLLNYRVLSLDAMTIGHANIRVSRHYDLGGRGMLRFAESPGYPELDDQLEHLEPGDYVLMDDDIHTTGGTIRYMTKLIERRCNLLWTMTFKVSDSSDGEIADLRDFFVGHPGGLVLQHPDGRRFRAPYVYPYVCPHSRASIQDPLHFSIDVWRANARIYRDRDELVYDLGSTGQLFELAGIVRSDEPVYVACERHAEMLERLIIKG